MNELTVFKFNNIDVVDSREVAEMIGKRHDHLIRDIKNYFDVLMKNTSPNFGVSDFFIKSSYKDSTGRTLLCYLLTKKGCDMVANKMTGEKGVLFTAAYVTAFESMRHNQNSYDDLVQVLTSVDSVLKNIAAKLDAVCTRASIPESKNKPYEIKDETAMSAWKAQVYSVAKPLARRMDVTVKCLLSKIYTRMKNEYSWDYKEEKRIISGKPVLVRMCPLLISLKDRPCINQFSWLFSRIFMKRIHLAHPKLLLLFLFLLRR